MRVLQALREQWIGVLGVFIGLTGVAFGATGQPALLGRANKANVPTTFENTASGPAAGFATKPGQPPFEVNSSKLVKKLNAAQLGGRGPNAFARAGTSHTKAEADARYIDTAEIGGYYTKAQVNAGFAPAAGSTAYLANGVRVLEAAGQPDKGVDGSGGAAAEAIYFRKLTAPAAGTISIAATGLCTSTDGLLYVEISNVRTELSLSGGEYRLCDATARVGVAAGDEVNLTVGIYAENAVFLIKNWSTSVVFTPS